MSDKLPKPNSSEELDLGQLFSFIERGVSSIGKLILKGFNFFLFLIKKLVILIVLSLNIFKKHILKVVAAGILTYILFTMLDRYAEPIYQSNMIVKQNYDTGKILYNNIARYNLLASASDSVALGSELSISYDKAADIVGLEVFDDMNEIDLLQRYNEHLLTIDTTNAITFKDFKKRYHLESHPIQVISVNSRTKTAFDGLSNALVKVFENNPYFKEEQRKANEHINNKIKDYESMLIESDSLQSQYFQLLKMYYGQSEDQDPANPTFNVNLSSSKDKVNTREYELFNRQNDIKLEISNFKDELEDAKEILSLQKNFTPPVKKESFFSEFKKSGTFIIMLIVFLFYMLKETKVLELVETYGTKEKLLEK
ncbi:hypothetical protein OAD62_00350 [Oceanihabitans sp.]|nr:hypothetical protein [Oceanihabitans sp.]